ncbi:MAG TPA: alpha/beta hydrolase [Gaiellales bacterium]|jgi:pimeloyl-ACP methyl ester carboxylesterase
MSDLLDIGGGVRLAYDDRGSGRPVVLIHGVSMSRRFFERNLDGLAERFRVVNIDLRGHGESPAHEGGHTVAQYARDVRAAIGQLGLDGAVLVGWSMGTMVVWELVKQFGTAGLAGHVNVSQGPSDLKREGWDLGAFSEAELFGLLEAAQDDFHGVMAEFVPAMFADERPAAELEMLVSETQKLGANAATCILLDQSLRDFREVVGSYELPTLCSWGRDEKLVPVAAGDWLAARGPADLHIFEHSGHCPMWEEPELWNQVVGDWIARL